ncbi:MAG: response regulator [Anaerolineales bacterium]|nr:response regulator [Anaerolineales bacterium]
MSTAETILIIDDNPETLRLISLVLERQGYKVLVANDGYQGLAMAQRELPSLVLLDIMMPGLDGLQVARRLRADPDTTDIPIIIFTAKSGLDDELLGFEAGADDYLTKLASPAELVARVRAVLGRVSKVQRGSMIGVLAAKGGVGVSTVALNLGVALFEQIKDDVIIADFRPGQGSIGLILGYPNPQGLNHLLQCDAAELAHASVESELIRHRSGVRLLLSSYQPEDARYINAVPNIKMILRYLPQIANYVVLDIGSTLLPVNTQIIKACDLVVILVEPVEISINHTLSLVQDLNKEGISHGKMRFVLVNRGGSSIQLMWKKVESMLGYELASIITPAGELAYQSSVNKTPLIKLQPDGLTAEQFDKLARAVIKK